MKILITGGSGFIGTNLVEFYRGRGAEVRNIDIAPPRHPAHLAYWKQADITSRAGLEAAAQGFEPDTLVHLAARTDLLETRRIEGYAANIGGVRNVCLLCAGLPRLRRAIFASSMLVCRNGYAPSHSLDYCPSTLYGMSKVAGERIVRECAALDGRWAIVRPTSIWGPWFEAPYRDFFLAIARGRYLHPGGAAVRKALGYVGNTAAQIGALAAAGDPDVRGRVFYLADQPAYTIGEWAERIRAELGARRIPRAPAPLMRGLALAGDCLKRAGWTGPPLTSFRLNNLLTSSAFDMTALDKLTGRLPYTMPDGVALTAGWMRSRRLLPGRLREDSPVGELATANK